MNEKRTIVCFSSQPWSDGMWTNKQHVMSRMASRYRVIFVNFGGFHLTKWYRRRKASEGLGSVLRPTSLMEPSVQHFNGVEVLDFLVELGPLARLDEGHPLRVAYEFDWRTELTARWLAKQGILDAILWVYHPGYGPKVADIPHSLVAYDCVDEYIEFPAYKKNPTWLREREEALCKRADLVFTTSKGLFERKRPLNPEHTHLVHNVGDAEHFEKALAADTQVPEDMAKIPGPRIVFVGAVSDYKLDSDAVLAAARAHPEWSLVLIGPVGVADPGTKVHALASLPNVHLLGHRRYPELPAYLKGADVTVIPYRTNEYTDFVFPIKFFEMLATGRPLVISPLPAVEDFYDLVSVARTPEEFVARCEDALAHPERGAPARLAAARANSWPARVGRLTELLEARLGTPSA